MHGMLFHEAAGGTTNVMQEVITMPVIVLMFFIVFAEES